MSYTLKSSLLDIRYSRYEDIDISIETDYDDHETVVHIGDHTFTAKEFNRLSETVKHVDSTYT